MLGVLSLRWQRRITGITADRMMPGAALPRGLCLALILAEQCSGRIRNATFSRPGPWLPATYWLPPAVPR